MNKKSNKIPTNKKLTKTTEEKKKNDLISGKISYAMRTNFIWKTEKF